MIAVSELAQLNAGRQRALTPEIAVAGLSIFLAFLNEFFDVSEVLGLPVEVQRRIGVGVLTLAAGCFVVAFVRNAMRNGMMRSFAAQFFGFVVISGFIFDFVTSLYGTVVLLSGQEGVDRQLVVLFALFFTLCIFAVTIAYEYGFGAKRIPKWTSLFVYIPLFVLCAIFDIATSTVGFAKLFNIETELSFLMAIMAFASMLVFVCQIACVEVYLHNRPIIQFGEASQNSLES